MGGHIGLILTLANPELVHSLVLTGSSGLYEKVLEKPSQEEGQRLYQKENRKFSLTRK